MLTTTTQPTDTVNADISAPDNRKVPLLFLCHRIPYPPDKGDKIRAFHLLRHLSRHFDVHLACFVDDPRDWSAVPDVEKYCRESFFRTLDPRLATLRSMRGLIKGTALSLPYYADKALQRWVAHICEARNIRHAVVYSSVMAQFLPTEGSDFLRKIIDFVDVDSDKWRQYATRKPWPLSWLYRREAQCLLHCERELAARFDAGLFVSSTEAALFRQLSPVTAHKTGFYNNGVDGNYFDPQSSSAAVQKNPYTTGCQALVFTGAMNYWPNVDAVIWFTHAVLPSLQREHPALVFYIVGGRPSIKVQRLARLPGVIVTGRVPDVRPYLRFGLATIAPMRVARGVQNKVLEAMAMALPVLVSRKGLEGIDAEPGEHVLLADNVDEYRRGIGEIIAGRQSDLGARARDFVLEAYDWDHSLPKVVDLLTGSGDPHQTGSLSHD